MSDETILPEPDDVDPTVRRTPPSKAAPGKSHLDEIPPEAQAFADDPSRRLHQYILVRQVGKGGMGTVWKAWDRRLTRWIAIKFLLATEDDDVQRFQREAKLAARLRHPNIAPIFEVGEVPSTVPGQQGRHYLAMEFIDGESLSTVNLPMREAIEIFVKVAQGIEAAHKAGVVHRDLKPQNIMLTSGNWPYVMDFGLAKSLQAESSISVSGAIMGTPAYMSPEQAQGRIDQIDERSDVYSLGATLYAVLTRKQPFSGGTVEILMKVCKEDPEPPRAINPEVPEPVERIILKAMAKEKDARYASSGELAEDLQRYLADEDIHAYTPRTLRMGLPGRRKRGPLIAVLALIVAVAGFFAVRPKDTPPPPPPPVDDASARRDREWQDAWHEIQKRLAFNGWQAADTTLADQAGGHLKRMAADAPSREAEVAGWFETQVVIADGKLRALAGSLETRREQAARIVAWLDVVRGLGAASTDQLRAAAAAIASDRGRFTLKILVGPYAQVTRLTRDGKPVPLAQPHTPLVAAGLVIGDYELELTHPQGKKIVKIPAARLKDGKTYLVSGRAQDAEFLVTELP